MEKSKVLVIGLGLIGGSLALNMMQSKDNIVYGYDSNPKSMKYALQNGIIHEAIRDIPTTVKQVDCVILATPITPTIQMMQEIDSLLLPHKLIMTDVCSVKGSVMTIANKLTNPNITFIGGHPMAGSHKKGVTAATKHLFENAIYVLTPIGHYTNAQLTYLKELLQYTNSRFHILDPDKHDEMTGVISHFPHLIASSLVHQAKRWEKTHPYIPKLAAGGFRDITRIASSNPEMWEDIFHHNHEKMSRLLHEWITEMVELKGLIDLNDHEKMVHYLTQAKMYRDGLDKGTKGAIPAFYDIYVDIPDQSGAVSAVVQLLATNQISFKNIEILEIRENVTGVLRISFPTETFRHASYTILKENGFELVIGD